MPVSVPDLVLSDPRCSTTFIVPPHDALLGAMLQQVPMKLDRVCRVGKGARASVVRVTCKLDCARRAHAVGCQWWARRAKRAFAHPYDSLRAERAVGSRLRRPRSACCWRWS